MGSLVRRIVWHPGHLLPGSVVIPADQTGLYDVMIGDIPFMAAYAPDAPFQRQTAQYRKDQQDQTTEPGEQSLTGWWRRSQTSFHGGAGRDYEEPRTSADTSATTQFHDSQGVDVWTPGKVTLLPAAVNVAGSGGDGCIAAGTGALHWTTNTLKFTSWSGDTPTTSVVSYGDTHNVLAAASDGSNYYVATSAGIFKGALNAGAGSLAWNPGASATVALGWCKQRLMFAEGPRVYELTTGAPTLPSPKYTHPASGWTWTGFAEGPDAIYAAGYAGDQSAMFQFVLDTSTGSVPTLSTGITAFTMPTGEQIRSVGTYLNGYVILGTNRGLRVCPIEPDGSVRLGPLVVNFKTMGVSAGPVTAVTGRDRFVYGTLSQGMPDGTSGLVRVDLGNIDQNNLFAWATDLQAHSSANVTGVAVVNDRMVFSVSGVGLKLESSVSLESTGTLTTGRIRYHSLEPKLFKQVQMRALPLHGNLQCSVIDQAGNANTLPQIVGIGQETLDVQDISLDGKQEYVSLRFTLSSSGGLGPTFTGYQLNALPATARQRQETLILSCFDNEEDRNNRKINRPGYALQRLLALEALEDAADLVLIQHLTADPLGLLTGLVVIDSVRIVQQKRPAKINGFGGLLEVVVRRP